MDECICVEIYFDVNLYYWQANARTKLPWESVEQGIPQMWSLQNCGLDRRQWLPRMTGCYRTGPWMTFVHFLREISLWGPNGSTRLMQVIFIFLFLLKYIPFLLLLHLNTSSSFKALESFQILMSCFYRKIHTQTIFYKFYYLIFLLVS